MEGSKVETTGKNKKGLLLGGLMVRDEMELFIDVLFCFHLFEQGLKLGFELVWCDTD
jgi:hypothetical protein